MNDQGNIFYFVCLECGAKLYTFGGIETHLGRVHFGGGGYACKSSPKGREIPDCRIEDGPDTENKEREA